MGFGKIFEGTVGESNFKENGNFRFLSYNGIVVHISLNSDAKKIKESDISFSKGRKM